MKGGVCALICFVTKYFRNTLNIIKTGTCQLCNRISLLILYFLIRVVMVFQISIFQGRRILYKLLSGDMRYSREEKIFVEYYILLCFL